jgi:hypothetical protein
MAETDELLGYYLHDASTLGTEIEGFAKTRALASEVWA